MILMQPAGPSRDPVPLVARRVLIAFVATFLAARLLVLLITLRVLPDLFVHLGGTHVHHLNFGIFLLAGVGAWLLFSRPHGRRLRDATYLYGVGLALTFDEFGMWLHLSDQYWQQASFDAVVLIGSALMLLTVTPRWSQMRVRHLVLAVLLLIGGAAFFTLQRERIRRLDARVRENLWQLDAHKPP